MQLSNIFIGLIFSGLIAGAGYYKKALSKSGVAGAMLVGTVIFAFGGLSWGLILIAFFISSSALSFFKGGRKARLSEKFDKGHRRDFGQAMANAGFGAVLAIGSVIAPSLWWGVAFLGAMAAVAADTWATELGVLSKSPPRMITTFRRAAPGESGAISLVGTLASLAGGLFIGATAALLIALGLPFFPADVTTPAVWLIVVSGLGGLAGGLFDSWLGAMAQAMYFCQTCQSQTEQKVHRTCGGTPTQLSRGWRWLSNDWVNVFCSAMGALVAVLIGLMIS